MTNIEAIKYVSQLNDYMVIRYKVFMTNLILSLDLINLQLEITIGFEIFYPHSLSKLKANEKSIVLDYIIRIGFH